MRKTWSLLWAAKFIAKWEGFLPSAYLDTIASPAVYTIGYGHTGNVRPGEVWSKAKALRVLARDARSAAAAVTEYIDVKLTVRQRMALISLAFNAGSGILDGTTITTELNKRHYQAASDALLLYCHNGAGVVIPGLLNRRRDERAMFLSRRSTWRKWERRP